MNEDHNEGIEEVEQQPHIHHLHVGGLGQVVAHVDEHCSQHQHRGQVNSDDSLQIKISPLEIDYLIFTSKKKALKKLVE